MDSRNGAPSGWKSRFSPRVIFYTINLVLLALLFFADLSPLAKAVLEHNRTEVVQYTLLEIFILLIETVLFFWIIKLTRKE